MNLLYRLDNNVKCNTMVKLTVRSAINGQLEQLASDQQTRTARAVNPTV